MGVVPCDKYIVKNKKSDLVDGETTETFNPIFKWSTRQIWLHIKKHNISYCELYDQGYTRIGCIGCPMTGYNNLIRDMQKMKDQIIDDEIKKGLTIRMWDLEVKRIDLKILND